MVSYCRRRGKSPERTLLDSSYHYTAMRGLPNSERRGRPDILHFTILEVLGSPLNKAGKLATFIHTQAGVVIEVNPKVRLPRNYDRFKSLFEKLLVEKIIKADTGEILLRVLETDLSGWRRMMGAGSFVLLSETGAKLERRVLEEFSLSERPVAFILGCFPHGDFSQEVRRMADMEVRLSDYTLDAWVAASRIICLLESFELSKTHIDRH